MTSLIRYELWRDGYRKLYAGHGTIVHAKAQDAACSLVRLGLATVAQEGNMLVYRCVPGMILDRKTHPNPPSNIDASV